MITLKKKKKKKKKQIGMDTTRKTKEHKSIFLNFKVDSHIFVNLIIKVIEGRDLFSYLIILRKYLLLELSKYKFLSYFYINYIGYSFCISFA